MIAIGRLSLRVEYPDGTCESMMETPLAGDSLPDFLDDKEQKKASRKAMLAPGDAGVAMFSQPRDLKNHPVIKRFAQVAVDGGSPGTITL